ncbi:signal recognition particle-docking protein FtsY [Caldivirga maquilingensis]|uniref:Signal recognition particle receptor FtsY n=1 Tax=Caldivirga maquilingensis (strain ATCC 700844 / DSM 13496 / JCM 10307 / IC-167) TaxID=397948 RepID=A8MD49_CALMQ|nr:signal recognition particle-docking protein FtsY [Caldivirga maquilingensis]ABW01705.1 signal recognition particle-docking protein FtsY [Caldivirga maquilingensis IC-167]
MFNRLKSAFSSLVKAIGDAVTQRELTEDDVNKLLGEFEERLIEYDVALDTAEALISELKAKLIGVKVPRFSDNDYVKALVRDTLMNLLSSIPDVDFDEFIKGVKKRPIVLLFLGPNGYGKTTTIAKLTNMLLKRGMSVVWAAADTYRAGAVEQLEGHAAKLGVRVIKHPYGSDPASVAYDAIEHAKARGISVVMIDTAGRMHTDRNLMEELRKVHRVSSPDASIFIVDALMGNDAVDVARTYSKYIPIDFVVVTKVDAYVKGGVILTLLYELKKPIIFLGTGQGYDDLIKFNKLDFINKLLE